MDQKRLKKLINSQEEIIRIQEKLIRNQDSIIKDQDAIIKDRDAYLEQLRNAIRQFISDMKEKIQNKELVDNVDKLIEKQSNSFKRFLRKYFK